jgi:23S rRNA pseudouridine2605 synthase
MSERLQKVLARAGLGSRREIEGWIQAGRIQVNGVTAELGVQVDGTETINIDGKTIALAPPEATRVIAYHKPLGEIATRSDPEGRPTVFDNLPRLQQGRWIGVGRLDISTSGLLLFTNDGELANRLMHPSRELEREYAVRVFGEVDGLILNSLLEGVELEDGPAHFLSVRDAGGSGSNRWYHVVLGEGRNREVRRLWESQGVQVSRLIRVRYGPIDLGRRLPAGTWRDLTHAEVAALRDAAGLPQPAQRKPEQRKPEQRKPEKRKSDKQVRPARKGPEGSRTKRRKAQ